MGQPLQSPARKALVIGIVTHIFGALVAHTRLLLSFWTMVASVLVVLAWQPLVAAAAARTTATGKKPEAPIPLPWLSYPLFGRDCRAQLKERADQHRVRMRAEIRYAASVGAFNPGKNGGLLPKALTGNTLAIFSSTYTVATIPRFGPAWRLLAAALLAVLPELFQIEAAGFRDEEGAESGEGVGYAASKESPGESAIFAQASDEQWSQGAE
jgi:hypothetical protein